MPQTKTISSRTTLNLLAGDSVEIYNMYVPEPEPVTDLAAVGGYGEIVLTWTAIPEVEYRVEYSILGVDWVVLDSVVAGTKTHNGLTYRIGFFYRVIPILGGFEGTPSNVVQEFTLLRVLEVGPEILGNSKYIGGAFFNDKIYAPPFVKEFGIVFDTTDNSVTTMTGSFPEANSFESPIRHTDDVTYLVPGGNDKFGKLTLSTESIVEVGGALSAFSYLAGVKHTNGYIYCAPFKADRCLLFNIATEAWAKFGTTFTGFDKFATILESTLNGCIYALPRYDNPSANRFLKIDPSIDPLSPTTTLIGTTFTSPNGRFSYMVQAQNGMFYVLPDTDDRVWKLNPLTDTTTQIGPVFAASSLKFGGGILLADGRIICPALNESRCLVIDTNTDTVSLFGDTYAGSSKWRSFVMGSNGKLYAIPSTSTSILEVDPVTLNTYLVGDTAIPPLSILYGSGYLNSDGDMFGLIFNGNRFLKLTS